MVGNGFSCMFVGPPYFLNPLGLMVGAFSVSLHSTAILIYADLKRSDGFFQFLSFLEPRHAGQLGTATLERLMIYMGLSETVTE